MNRMMSRRDFLKRAVAAGAFGASSWLELGAALGQPVQSVRVGALYPLSGALARIGLAARHALELGVEIVNGEHRALRPLPLAQDRGLPRLGGARIELVWADTRGDPATGRAEAERLIEGERVVALIGCWQSAVTATVALAAERHGVPLLVPEASSPRLTERGYRWLFRTGPHDGMFTELIFDFVEEVRRVRRREVRKIAVLAEDTEFGATAAGWAMGLAQRRGYSVVARELYTSPPTSLTAELLRIRAAGPDVVIGANYLVDAILITRTLKELQWFPNAFIAHVGFNNVPDYLNTVGRDGHYFITRAAWAPGYARRNRLAGAVNQLFRQRTGYDLDQDTAREVMGVLVLADAINRAGRVEAEAIRRALVETRLRADQVILPWRGVEFDDKGQNRLVGGMMVQILDGEYKVVWPFEVAEAELVWPVPPWDRR